MGPRSDALAALPGVIGSPHIVLDLLLEADPALVEAIAMSVSFDLWLLALVA